MEPIYIQHQKLDLMAPVGASRTGELHTSLTTQQTELRHMESKAVRLAVLMSFATAERDKLRRHCHSLLLLLHHQAAASPSLHAASILLARGGCSATSTATVIMHNENMTKVDSVSSASSFQVLDSVSLTKTTIFYISIF